jgi:hypothetical protein
MLSARAQWIVSRLRKSALWRWRAGFDDFPQLEGDCNSLGSVESTSMARQTAPAEYAAGNNAESE